MFLSRVEIDTKNRRKIKELTHLGAYHNWVEQSFPDEFRNPIRLRHLWRLDELGDKQYLLILSKNRPNIEGMERYGIPGSAQIKLYDKFLAQLETGQQVQFRLTANPTYAAYQAGERGRIYPHVTITQQLEWLIGRSELSGFHIPQLVLQGETNSITTRAFDIISRDHPILKKKNSKNIRVSRVTFEGKLEIQNLTNFKNALLEGIGREKAYGMGLMTVIPER
ncbi:type I-E CRISPR-associated protein Cas6/Cse3/CasE [Oenococcus sicerae]|uniref:Type I-E CRISPR-associated protein Cas6/Cse3/CasE n=1 Tax=Oenococcus sicerae TaxID=2203724 RepID=A0ABX5QPF2_9LACO|nr:type I-E CRISPR-associated protein Cas6/Cse3/CasE [Oenococcus sicerae]QAS70542.1 type I-E CRISPR-associated protein Cas6/Cse3/CasE [Oenococcus sicerae]